MQQTFHSFISRSRDAAGIDHLAQPGLAAGAAARAVAPQEQRQQRLHSNIVVITRHDQFVPAGGVIEVSLFKNLQA